MEKDTNFQILRLLLRPVARFCVKRSVKLQTVVEGLKSAMVEEARSTMEQSGLVLSSSRLSIMTGVHRRDVSRLVSQEPVPKTESSLLGRVIGQWRNSKRFMNRDGTPKCLEFEGKQSEFVELVGSVSKDLNPYTVLFELERTGSVSRTADGLKLLSSDYVPKDNTEEGLKLLAADSNDLFDGIMENLFEAPKIPNLHIKTEYDNISPESVPKISNWILKQGTAFHLKIQRFVSQFDRDVNSSIPKKGGRVRVAVGSFSRVEDNRQG